MRQLVVIGGGASGIAAAIEGARAGARVLVLEAGKRVGAPILASGNGRCNYSNSGVGPAHYHGSAFVERAFSACPPRQVWDWFADLGLASLEESEGRLYPAANKASSVLDVLRFALDELGVEVRCESPVARVRPVGSGWELGLKAGAAILVDAVVVAAGGGVARSLLPDGLAFEPPVERLCGLHTDRDPLRGLDGVRARAEVRLFRGVAGKAAPPSGERASYQPVARERGELQFRPYGVSGIAVFNLSRFASAGDVLGVDFLPRLSEDALEHELASRISRYPKRSAEQLLAGLVLPAVAHAALRAEGITPDRPAADPRALTRALKGFELVVRGFETSNAQVHRGGFALEGFDPLTMESRTNPGLYVTGEALDVDGPCGGYNLHWAWTSGILAGRAAAVGPEDA